MLPPYWITFLIAATGLSACQLQDVKDGDSAPVHAPERLARLEQTLDRQKARIMELELRLLAEQSEVRKLSSSQEQAIQEVVRVKAKLRSHNSKAETVANLAEAKLALEGLRTKRSGALHANALQRADQYLSMSETALKSGNYDGASYLIGRANASLHATNIASDEDRESNSNLTTFALPVPMTVGQRCNVRAGPGLEKKVLYRLNAGKAVSATGYRGLWVQIRGTDKTAGWIHYSLLKGNP